jgi:hypothetical protein
MRARVYRASAAAREQLRALRAGFAAEGAARKAECEIALKRWAGLRQVPRPARAALAAAAMVGAA